MKNANKIKCRQCSSTLLQSRGRSVDASTFGGHTFATAWHGEKILECLNCHLQFKHPLKSFTEYAELYENAPPGVYTNSALRTDQELVLKAIHRHCKTGRLLDIGCYDGALLLACGDNYEKYGIEPSLEASNYCKRNGITIISQDLESTKEEGAKYDVIVAVDVIEHLEHPIKLIKFAERALAPNGTLILSTGNSSAPLWRFCGARYWYCAFPEHISFINECWLKIAISNTTLQKLDVIHFRHVNLKVPAVRAFIGFFGRFAKYALEVLANKLTRDSHPKKRLAKLGYPGIVKDHMIAVLKNTGGCS